MDFPYSSDDEDYIPDPRRPEPEPVYSSDEEDPEEDPEEPFYTEQTPNNEPHAHMLLAARTVKGEVSNHCIPIRELLGYLACIYGGNSHEAFLKALELIPFIIQAIQVDKKHLDWLLQESLIYLDRVSGEEGDDIHVQNAYRQDALEYIEICRASDMRLDTLIVLENTLKYGLYSKELFAEKFASVFPEIKRKLEALI